MPRQRDALGEDERIAGYMAQANWSIWRKHARLQIAHLITYLNETVMSVPNAVRGAHRSYPANRIVGWTLPSKKALQPGRKHGVLHVGCRNNDEAQGLTVKQSFTYWKHKDLKATVMVSYQSIPLLSI